MNQHGTVIGFGNAIYKRLVERDVMNVEGAMRPEIRERPVRQIEGFLERVSGAGCNRSAGAFEDEHHAEKTDRIKARDHIVGVRD